MSPTATTTAFVDKNMNFRPPPAWQLQTEGITSAQKGLVPFSGLGTNKQAPVQPNNLAAAAMLQALQNNNTLLQNAPNNSVDPRNAEPAPGTIFAYGGTANGAVVYNGIATGGIAEGARHTSFGSSDRAEILAGNGKGGEGYGEVVVGGAARGGGIQVGEKQGGRKQEGEMKKSGGWLKAIFR